jgi:predicted ABC-class ATPase
MYIQEALELGASVLVKDDDTCAIYMHDARCPMMLKMIHLNLKPHMSTIHCGYACCLQNLQEALELGASVLLMDEDTCATNFMMRDARMAALVAPHKEPITPFSSRIA